MVHSHVKNWTNYKVNVPILAVIVDNFTCQGTCSVSWSKNTYQFLDFFPYECAKYFHDKISKNVIKEILYIHKKHGTSVAFWAVFLVTSLVTCATFLNTSNLGSVTVEQDKNHCYLKLVANYLTFVQWGFSRFTDKKIPVPGNVLQVSVFFI